MADEKKSAEAEINRDKKNAQFLDENSKLNQTNDEGNTSDVKTKEGELPKTVENQAEQSFVSPKSEPKGKKTSSTNEISPDISTYTNTSRYGRARKPKITEDFYNIEDIFGPYERITSSSPRRKPHKLELSPSKASDAKINLSVNIPDDNNIEVSKVMKMVANNDFSPKSPPYPSKSIKTYVNKHKKILESHEYKVNGAKFKSDSVKSETNDKSDIYKSVRLFSDDSFDSNDSFSDARRTKKSAADEVSDIKRDFDSEEDISSEDFAKLAKNNKKINKLQRDLNIVQFKTGRLRSSIADRSSTEDEQDPEDTKEESLKPEVPVKTEVVEEPEVEESNTFTPDVGTLAWSRVGTYPFWPSIVTNEPGFDRHSRIVMFGRKYVKCYHVNFFGDNGRRSWVLASHIFPFNRRSDLEIMARNVSKDSKPKDPKHLSAFIINPNKLKKWETAVTEAEGITDFPSETRIEKFFEMVSPKKKSLKRSLGSPKSGKIVMAHKKIKLDKKALKKFKKKLTKKDKNKPDEERLQSPSPTIKEEPLEDKPPKSKIKNPKNKLEPDKPEKRKSKPSEEPKSDESSSDSDSKDPLIKEEIRDTPSPQPQLSSIQRQKRINLFRGITKERVCQICGKNKQVYKCKGNCYGLYHIECDKKVRLRVLSRLSEEKSSNSEDSDEEATRKAKRTSCDEDASKNSRRNSNISDKSTKLDLEIEENSRKVVASIMDNILGTVFAAIDHKNQKETSSNLIKIEEHLSDEDESISSSKTVEIPTKIEENTSSSGNATKNHDNPTKNEDNSCPTEELLDSTENSSKLAESSVKTVENLLKTADSTKTVENSSKTADNSSKTADDSSKVTENSSKVTASPASEETSSKTVVNPPTIEDKPLKNVEQPSDKIFKRSLSLAEQIDLKMAEVMQNLITETKYTDSTTDEGSENEDPAESIIIDPFKKEATPEASQPVEEYSHLPAIEEDKDKKVKIIKHVTADGIFDIIEEEEVNNEDFRCAYCCTGIRQPCFICNKEIAKSGDSKRHKCFTAQCGKYYHSECLKDWPQTKWNVSSKSKKIENETLSCPYHNCHTCISDNPRGPLSRYTNEKLTKCIRCPTTYHSNNFCIPAGTEILSSYQLICPKHLQPTEEEEPSLSPNSRKSIANDAKKPEAKKASKSKEEEKLNDAKKPEVKKSSKSKIMPHMNASWCFICSMGGSLICCETCPSAFHVECLKLVPPEGKYLCEECESGRLPLYDEIVWVKLGAYRWWPAQILYPADVPPNVASIPHTIGEFVVRFFGSHDHYWVNRGRVFLFQEGDTGHASSKKSAVDGLFVKAIEEATRAHKKFIDERANRAAEAQNGMKPPAYIKIKVNRPVGNVRANDADTSNTTPCDCDPSWDQPCGPDSDCLNRILMTECNPMVCAAGSRCCNQSFEKRLYAPVAPIKTTGRGWGLRSLAPISKGSFVIEYVGEVIDEMEYRRRMKRKHDQKDENYYFLTIDKDRMIDAGPKGNVARFMNHSCSPNCETQKWTINGDTRVGLFAITDIPTGAELTFNYNLECIGEEKKECRCGAPNCSGFIGVKAKQDEVTKKRKSVPLKSKKKKSLVQEIKFTEVITCFVCGQADAIQPCDRDACNKFYHLHCVSLENYQEGKWLCPWHSCSICTKRTTRCCYMCINSYCPLHSEGNIRYERNKGFVCTRHDIKEEEDPKDLETPSEEAPKTKDPTKVKKTKKQIQTNTDSNKHEMLEPKQEPEEPKSSSEQSSRRSSKSDEPEIKLEIKEEKIRKGKISKISEESLNNEETSSEDHKKEITIKNGAIIGEIPKQTLVDAISSSDEIIQIDIMLASKPNNINSSIKKRKSRLSLKKNYESSSSQDDLSDDEKPLVTRKKIKLSEDVKSKVLRSSRSASQEKSSDSDSKPLLARKTPNCSSLDLDCSSSDSDFVVKKIVKKKSAKKGNRANDNTEPKKLRSSMNSSISNEDKKVVKSSAKEDKPVKVKDKDESLVEKKTSPKVKIIKEDLPKMKKMLTSTPKVDNKKKPKLVSAQDELKTTNLPKTDLQTPKKETSSQEDLKPPKSTSPTKKFNLSLKKPSTPKNISIKLKPKSVSNKPERRLTRNLKNSLSDDDLEDLSNCSSIEMELSAEETKKSEDSTKENEDTGEANKKKKVRKSLRSTKLESSKFEESTKLETSSKLEESTKLEESATEEPKIKVEDIKEEIEEPVKRKRGRPRKYPRVEETPTTPGSISEPLGATEVPLEVSKAPLEVSKTAPKAPEVLSEAPEVLSEAPEVLSEAPEVPSETPEVAPVVKRPKGRPRKYPLPVDPPQESTEIYKPKLTEPKPFENHVKEVKLTANVPERHLRVVLRKNEIDQKIDNKFLKMQNDIERDLPIRKRSKLRYEAQL